MRYVGAEDVLALGYRAAIEAITDALRSDFDPATDPARTAVGTSHGQFLLMPSEVGASAGVKVVTVAPDNPSRGLPRIAAAYLLFDAETLQLQAILDGTALTTLRTPAVSVAAIRPALPDRPLDVVVVGSGPQAAGHAAALAAVAEIDRLSYLVRDPSRVALPSVALGSPEARDALASADVVVCATSARKPLFDSALLRGDAVVVAVGSHEPDARELDTALLSRAVVVVEDAATALREAGDVVLAVADGALTGDDLVPMRTFVREGGRPDGRRPEGRVVVKTVGMAWQDLVVADAVVSRLATP